MIPVRVQAENGQVFPQLEENLIKELLTKVWAVFTETKGWYTPPALAIGGAITTPGLKMVGIDCRSRRG